MPEPKIIYEDDNFLAVAKPAGLIVHKTRRGGPEQSEKEQALTDWLLKRYPEIRNVGDEPETRPGIVHRLDKDASGLLLIAKNQRYFNYLKSLFQKQQIEKKYLAFVFGRVRPKVGVIEKPIGIKSGSIKRSIHSEKMAKAATTAYKVLQELKAGEADFFSLLEIKPATGRTHQIRVHLSGIGHPLVGDKLYGRKKQPQWAARLMLHAYSLGFRTAEGRRIQLEVEPPRDFRQGLDYLRPI
jgi:23S rRNA pseudouridine1911/1915/1917 synthase